jgi:hypothetical protein
MWDVGLNRIDHIMCIVLMKILTMSCWANWPRASQWTFILEFCKVESRKHNTVSKLLSFRDWKITVWQWCGPTAEAASQFQSIRCSFCNIIWLSSRTHPPFCCSLPLPPAGPLSVTHRNLKIGRDIRIRTSFWTWRLCPSNSIKLQDIKELGQNILSFFKIWNSVQYEP